MILFSNPFLTCLPFILLLVLIALLPLAAPRFWHPNRNKLLVSALVSLPVLAFLVGYHPADLGVILSHYVSFIVLLAALFVISGGILVTGDLRATPLANTFYLLFGAVLANFIGTTGASMVLIRPLLKTISERKFTYHIPVFFIFIVSNIGGCLTPLGDPPLFLGYLKGVPFAWTLSLLPEWLFCLILLLGIFFVWDSVCFRRERREDILRDRTEITPLGVSGKWNLLFLLGVVLAVFFQVPAPYREMAMLAMALLSLRFTPKDLRDRNKFTFYPIAEVAILFAGIFVTMEPVLRLLSLRGSELGLTRPYQFFWTTGLLSSFLDNAPTYLTFFSLAESVTRSAAASVLPVVAGVQADLLRAISCGAVFMGAMTYIGNAPNFMVKSLAEEQGVRVPHFLGYMVYAGMILIPVFLLVTLVFFRG
jgi:Na+/H+ antiporter NhaD/arsenite permease-like protein